MMGYDVSCANAKQKMAIPANFGFSQWDIRASLASTVSLFE